MLKYTAVAGFAALFLSSQVFAQPNPRPGWKDSYSVDGVCYCDSNGFDHGADRLRVDTPIGELSVVQICADITSVLGTGRSSGRALYNDLQCGNGPPNNAGDEDPDQCPGRVDLGSSGCQIIGPRWDLEAVYGDGGNTGGPTTPLPPVIETGTYSATASNNSGDTDLAIDGDPNTRWTTEGSQRPGQTFTLDLGDTENVNQVFLNSVRSPNDGPAGYNLAVSTNGRNFNVVATGNNGGELTVIDFPTQSARFIRITQTGSKSGTWWSIHEISVGDDGGEGNGGSNGGSNGGGTATEALDRSGWVMYASRNSALTFNATDGNDNTRWTTTQDKQPGQFFEIDLQTRQTFSSIALDSSASPNDFPSSYNVLVSNDGNNFNRVASGNSSSAVTTIEFSEQNARYIRIEQNGTSSRYWWSIHEINVLR